MDTQPTPNELWEVVAKDNNLDSVNMSIAHIDQRLAIEENILSKLQMDNKKKRMSMNRSRLSLDMIESEIMDLHRKFADIKEKKARLHNISESNSIEAADDQTEQFDQINAHNPPKGRQLKTKPTKKQTVAKGARGAKKSKQIERVEGAEVATKQATDSFDTNSNVLDNIENIPEVRTRPQRLRTKPKCCVQCQHVVMNANIAMVRQKRKASKVQKNR